MPTEDERAKGAPGLEDVLLKLSCEDRERVIEALRSALVPARWFNEHGTAIAKANIASIQVSKSARILQALQGSKLDMAAMAAIYDTTASDEQRITSLIQALQSLLAEHQLVMAVASQLLEQVLDFESKSKAAADAVLAFRKLPEDN